MGDAEDAHAGRAAPPPLEYQPPPWSGAPKHGYSLDVIKSGTLVESIELGEKPFYVIGRLPICDIPQEHASLSRYHAVIQFNDKGFPFIYDLGSTHGTFLNKRQLEDRVFVRLFTNDSIRFGASSRLFVVQAPPSTTQMEEDEKEQRMRDKIAKLQQKEEEQARSSQVDAASDGPAGISWGMSESAPVEDDAEVELNDEPLEGLNDGDVWYMKDPRKILKHWFEHNGEAFDFEHTEENGRQRVHTVRLRLPIDNSMGMPIYATGRGPRIRDAETACCLDACRKLHMRKVMLPEGQADALSAERKKRRREMFGHEDELSDDDSFFDRTGAVERRQERAKKGRAEGVAAGAGPPETFQSLTAKMLASYERKMELLGKSAKIEAEIAAMPQLEEDDLDAVVQNLKVAEKRKILAAMQEELLAVLREMAHAEKLLKVLDKNYVFEPPKRAAPAPAAKQSAPSPHLTPKLHPTQEDREAMPPPPVAGAAATPSMPPPPATFASMPPPPLPLATEPQPSAALAPAAPAPTDSKPGKRVLGAPTRKQSEDMMETEVETWVPPAQDRAEELRRKLGY